MKRVILHCDCNSFFASVETVLHPEYRGVPMAVCGSTEDRRGIVLAKNELAKKYGIKTAETVYSAKKKCPSLVIARPHHGEYEKFSKRANEIYHRYTDMVEPFGIDESWLDVTASGIFGTGEEIAEKIRSDIKSELGITVSIGVSFNKVFAKFGSDYKKPDAITVINEENYKRIIYPLGVESLLFVGAKTADVLHSLGIKTIGELAEASPAMLEFKLGKGGALLSKYARGEDDSPVVHVQPDAKSIGNGLTFRHDLTTREECLLGINHLTEDIARKLRQRKMKCTTVQLSIKDEFLRVIQRQRPQNPPTDLSEEIAKTAYGLLVDFWPEHKPVRMLTVSAQGLVHSEQLAEQIDIFSEHNDTKREKSEKRERVIDEIKERFGNASITTASVIDNDIGI